MPKRYWVFLIACFLVLNIYSLVQVNICLDDLKKKANVVDANTDWKEQVYAEEVAESMGE